MIPNEISRVCTNAIQIAVLDIQLDLLVFEIRFTIVRVLAFIEHIEIELHFSSDHPVASGVRPPACKCKLYVVKEATHTSDLVIRINLMCYFLVALDAATN